MTLKTPLLSSPPRHAAGCLCVILAAAGLSVPAAHATVADATSSASSVDAERRGIDAFISRFLTAFENLELRAFMDCFAEDATVFFPVPEPPDRVAGRAAIQQRFQQVFARIRKDAPAGPPYHHLVPEDTQVQMIGPEQAVVTFELKNTERIARRTLVLRKSQGQWRIVHLHASNVPLESVRAAGKQAAVDAVSLR